MIRRIYFYPVILEGNLYPKLQIQILKGLCNDIRPLHPLALVKNVFRRSGTVAILNLFEDRTGYHKTKPNRTFLSNVVALLALKVACEKIIWVRHNYWPHDLPRKYFRQDLLLALMQRLSTKIVTHRELGAIQSIVSPHPIYFEGNLPETVRDIEFLYFGAIKRYKGLDRLLEVWPREKSLHIAGSVRDPDLLAELQRIVEARRLDVEFTGRFLPDAELNALLVRTKFLVLPHMEDTMIVSGAFFHAASFGANILARRGDFSSYLQTQLKHIDPRRVVEELRSKNGAARCFESWKQILEL
jgi:beta-1,4-mannosyltransferase